MMACWGPGVSPEPVAYANRELAERENPHRRIPLNRLGGITPDLVELLQRAESSYVGAADELFALLYDELHRLAERHLQRGGAGLTLGTTTLVHDAYLNMADRRNAVFPDRARFFAYASRAMRGLVIDYARRHRAKKRGRDYEITLVEDEVPEQSSREAGRDLEALGDALDHLAELDPKLAELVDLHFFSGFSFGEIAELRGLSERTVQRDWRKARLLLHRDLREGSTLND
jgi:RNA polymerase sigma factor (TIGR02999 family)